MPKKRPSLFIIDGSNNVYRSYFAIRNLTNSAGFSTNAVYGFVTTLRKLLKDHNPDCIAVAFDEGQETARSTQYADYKKDRRPMPDDLVVQIPWVYEVLEGFRIPVIRSTEWEADDFIGSLACTARDRGYEVHDCGTHGAEPVDYPDFAHMVARKVADGECQWGIMIDGAGIGSAMVANKVPGVRAGPCYDVSSARNAREHNHANVLTLGAGLIGEGLAWQIVEEWLSTEWSGGRHAARVDKINAIDWQYSGTE